jgi:hypothetical protein
MEDVNPVKKLTFQKADLKTLGLRGWRRKALDRDKWKDVLEEAKARRGL